ncbi:phenylalanine--tRNA ligase subunit beta [Halorubrum lacusprofundi]|jgi:phenylalanyl-tRNA synthetase beta chain|uniref:Phenylalanine--tRNA ligase beta subunit n=1 Tax=Halorubrum lacusprofundi (strain ATCC 49239 / DSM 5036 / JCM 8891 / ACAM 34) TaxID=416348 RepID=SYFB_HALLT|nr:phenylalanine--tRNA ligase subunit beta [Halorubrum lacusprofundi]B9LU47.1 RecName: Full=Phenylalanine--tRNA ligase beta subunit; AltName: Full=Phenylalanyl-tRNA synthetase beta subunit; Short=PheRS [Halorubrum lacusprofundi ATCC 49239]ACM58241.1 phenylalanyl-tRNA synthetase, beta subunit [Halorubrum lacusprofundi ATCC 49239]MCG1006323.1 phenylalanine--tRNA ligase subunit beta [Halorubrum lacusprofundi]
MPVVDIDTDELRGLTGRTDTSDEEFKEDLFGLGLEFEGETDEDLLQFEFAPDRLDRLSVEGVARSLRYHYGDDRGVYVPETNDPEWTIEVDESVPDERPYVTGAVIRGVDLDEGALDSLIQLQEKLHATMGRGRAKGAIGIHDLAMVKGAPLQEGSEPSITYRGVDPDGVSFVPLDANDELTPNEVLAEHDTGQTYADLVEGLDRYPAIYDELGLFSFPPVINGKRTEVTTGSRELFVELTGTDQWTIDRMCNIVCYALSARGATIEQVEVNYADGATAPSEYGAELVRPNFDTDEKSVSHDRIETLLGVDFEPEEIVDCFERAGLDASYTLDEDVTYEVEIPPYRVDVLHPLDLVDDVGRAYGFDNLEPRYPDVGTVGGRHERSRLEDAVRTSLVGLGFEDLLNFHMTSGTENYDRMNLEAGSDAFGGGNPVEITEPYSEEYTQLRTWAIPSLVMLLERNTHNAYPQDVAEVGFAAERDDSENTNVAERRHVAGAVARRDASYEAAKGRLQAVCDDFRAELETPRTEHPSFIDGRTAAVVIDGEVVGVIGEVHPAVLVEHDLEVPVAAFEFHLDALR